MHSADRRRACCCLCGELLGRGRGGVRERPAVPASLSPDDQTTECSSAENSPQKGGNRIDTDKIPGQIFTHDPDESLSLASRAPQAASSSRRRSSSSASASHVSDSSSLSSRRSHAVFVEVGAVAEDTTVSASTRLVVATAADTDAVLAIVVAMVVVVVDTDRSMAVVDALTLPKEEESNLSSEGKATVLGATELLTLAVTVGLLDAPLCIA